MASAYSPNLRIELIAVGEQSNTWGVTTNSNLGTLIEQAISGVVSVSVTAGNVTLTALDGATDQSRQMIIIATGTPGVARVITAPAVDKVYIVHNNSDASLSFIASGGTGVTLIVGAKKYIYCDGTNFYESINALTVTSGTIDGTTIGATTATTGKFTTVNASGQITSTVTTGTAPFVVASTTAVANLTASNVSTNANLTGAITSTGNATILGTASFTSANLAGALTDETGTGSAVFATSPTLVTPALGTPTALVGTNITGTASGLSIGGNAATATAATTATTATTASILNGTWNQMPAGTRVPFAQAAAPTGWTQDTSSNADNRMLRVVNTTGNGVGGSDSPIVNSTTMVAHTHTFTGTALAAHTHTDSGHTHVSMGYGGGSSIGVGTVDYNNVGVTETGYASISSNSAGTPSGSNSTTTGASWSPRYIDMIICAKN